MRKGLSVALAVAGLLVSGSALAALDLSQPVKSFWDWDLNSSIQALAALCSIGTLLLAGYVALTWKSQVRASHDVPLARRIALQLYRMENTALRAIGCAHFCLDAIEKNERSEVLQALAVRWEGESAKWENEVSELSALLLEASSVWGKDDLKEFDHIRNVVMWGVGCCTLFVDVFLDREAPLPKALNPDQKTRSLRKRAVELRIDQLSDPKPADAERMTEKAKAMLMRKL